MSFIHPGRGGDGPGDYPIYLQVLRGEVESRTGGFIAEVMLRWGHRGLHSKSIPIHIVVGGKQAYLLLAVSGLMQAYSLWRDCRTVQQATERC